jgi:hypothetical protein
VLSRSRLVLVEMEHLALMPEQRCHRSVTVTFNVILIIRWGKKRIELKIKIRF